MSACLVCVPVAASAGVYVLIFVALIAIAMYQRVGTLCDIYGVPCRIPYVTRALPRTASAAATAGALSTTPTTAAVRALLGLGCLIGGGGFVRFFGECLSAISVHGNA